MCVYKITGYDEPDEPFRLVKNDSVVIYESWTLANVWHYMREIVRSDYTCFVSDGKTNVTGLSWLAQMVYVGFIDRL